MQADLETCLRTRSRRRPQQGQGMNGKTLDEMLVEGLG
jgi:hypothetical protein